MAETYKILEEKDIKAISQEKQDLSLEVLNGLSKYPKRLSSKYFYDDEGSKIFSKITDVEEYYLTNCEYETLDTHKEDIAKLLENEKFNFIELGAGDGKKTKILLNHFLDKKLDFDYIPIDISKGAMDDLVSNLKKEMPTLSTKGIVADYFQGIKWLSQNNNRKNLVLFLGSNIGNFSKPDAFVFLRSLWNSLNNEDYLLIGFDLKKDIDKLLWAYNDSKNVTRDFNLNLLKRINKELGGNFDCNKFTFFATYNAISGAMESYIVSLEDQSVYIEELEQSFTFKAWEPIHTEYSYKYTASDINDLASHTGYSVEKQYSDSKKYFVDSIWKVKKKLSK